MPKKSRVVRLFDGDKRCESLMDAVTKLLYERGDGIPIPSILGILDLVKLEVIEGAKR